jgi:hypothetical protein
VNKGGILACAAGLLVVGCGTQGNQPSPAAEDARLLAVQESIMGTPAQRSAGEYLGNYALDAPVQKCMEKKGMPYEIKYLDTSIGTTTQSLGDTWTEPIDLTYMLHNMQVAAAKAPKEERLSSPPDADDVKATPEYADALNVCDDEEGSWNDASSPPSSMRLAVRLDLEIAEIERDFGGNGPYNDCMAAAGFDVHQNDLDGVDGLWWLLVDKAPPPADRPPPGRAGGPRWADFLAFADQALASDRACRAAKHAEAMSQVGPALDDFEQENATEIARIQAEWQSIVQEAQEKGWVDQTQRYS